MADNVNQLLTSMLQQYLAENIPLSASLGITISEASIEKIILTAPLLPNINHKKTVFGGSLHAVATLACWSLMFIHLQERVEPVEIVILSSNINYLLPVTEDFKAECIFPDNDDWIRFKNVFNRKGKAKVQLSARIYQGNDLAVDYQGIFAALKAPSATL